MTIIYLILLITTFCIVKGKTQGEDGAFWRELFKTISLRVLDYYCKGTPTKVVMLSLRILERMFGFSAISYPIIRAAIESNQENGFWKLWIDFQWDSASSTMTYVFLGTIALIVIIYLFTNRNQESLEKSICEIEKGNKSISNSVNNVGNKVDKMDDKLDSVLNKLDNSECFVIKHLLPELKSSISSLKIETAFKYLNKIYTEVEIYNKKDYSLLAMIQYLLGESARFLKGIDSKPFHDKAYKLMGKSGEQESEIIEGVIFESCKARKLDVAKQYAEELSTIDENNYWIYVPLLMDCDNLSNAYDELPTKIDKLQALATTIMLGGGKDHTLGIDLNTYQYHQLDKITISNIPLWIMDLSVATTLFCQHLVVRKDIKSMYCDYARDLFEISNKYLSLLAGTEMENILSDTVFLNAVTGYFKNQDEKWLDIVKHNPPTDSFKEIYCICYAIVFNHAKHYEDAKQILKEYSGKSTASILNMRCMLATQNNDLEECIDVFKYASIHNVVISDHLLNCYFGTLNNFYDSVRDFVDDITFENDLTKLAYKEFLNYKNGGDVDTQFILARKSDFSITLAPFMAIVAKEKISLDFAIELLEGCVDRKVFDIRTSLLIEYYQENPIYRQKLYHLLKELRLAKDTSVRNLCMELQMSNEVGDFANSLNITNELIDKLPDDDNVWVEHIQALYKCGSHESEIKRHKDRFIGKSLSTQTVICLFNIYHIINETAFALELLYSNIIRTQDQDLKDFLFSMHLNPEIDNLITPEKDVVELNDLITLKIDGEEKEIQVLPGTIYAELCGCKKNEHKTIHIKEDKDVEITSIHTKYNKLLRDIIKELGESNSSKNIKVFTIDDFDFKNNPISALQKMVGRPKDFHDREKALLLQYHNAEIPLLSFVNEHSLVPDFYDKIFGKFMVCTFPHESFMQLLENCETWEQKEIVLDLSSLIALHEFDNKFGLSYSQKFHLPKSVVTALKAQIINEEKGMPSFFSQYVTEHISNEIFDASKSILWNKLKSLEQWIDEHCIIELVEEIVNLHFSNKNEQTFRIEIESWLLAQKGMILLTEDWCYTKKFSNLFISMSTYNWLSLMNLPHAADWGQFMLECGNVGYPMTAEYIRSQYDLSIQGLKNNYQTCIENIKYNLPSCQEVVATAKGLLSGIIDGAKISGATNMLAILFRYLDEETCRLIVFQELIGFKDSIWQQCLVDALRISHPLVFL